MRAYLPFLALFALALPVLAADKVTYSDDVMPILRNSCLNCHNPDKNKAGLDMTNYQALMEGSDTRKVVEPGNSANSVLFKLVTHAAQPAMPPKSDKLPDSQIEILRKWIDGGALENVNSQAAIAKNSGPALEMFVQEKADGPPPMPHDLLLEPVLKTTRAGSVVSMAASPRSPIIAVAAQKEVLLYNTETLELAGVLPFPEGFPEVVKFSRDGRLVIAGGGIGAKSGRVVVWDVITGLRVMEAGDEYDAVLAVDISPDRHYIALGGPNKLVKIFKDGKLLHSIKKHTDWITALAFTPDGKLLISGDRQGGLCVWETSSGAEMFTLPNHKAGVTALGAPGPLAGISASEDGTVKMWDLREGREIKSWDANKGGVLSVAFAPDGKVVSAGRDKIVRLWNSDGTKVKEFEPFGDVALSAVISQGKVVGGDWTGAIRIWNTDGKRLAEWTPNPPTVSDHLTEVTARLADLQAKHAGLPALLADAEKAFAQSSEEARTAALAAAEKEKLMRAADTQVETLGKKIAEARAAAKKANDAYAQLQTTTQTLAADFAKADTANAAAQEELKNFEGTMQEKQAHLTALKETAKAAQAQADAQPSDQALVDAATKAKTEADKADEDFAADQKIATAKEADAQHVKDIVKKAQDALAANKAAITEAHDNSQTQTAAIAQLSLDLEKAKTAQTTAHGEFDTVAKALPPKSQQAKDAGQKLAKIKQDTEHIDHDIAVAKSDEAKWKAAQVNVALFAAKKELALLQSDRDKAAEAAKGAAAELDQAGVDLAATNTSLSVSPLKIKQAETEQAQAKQDAEKAAAAATTAKQELAAKQPLATQATLASVTAAAALSKSPGDVALKDAAARAKGSLEQIQKDLKAAETNASVKEIDATTAQEKSVSADKALAQAKSDAAALPAKISKLRASLGELKTHSAQARVAAEKTVSSTEKPMAAAKAKVETLTRNYETLTREAQAANPAVAELTKK